MGNTTRRKTTKVITARGARQRCRGGPRQDDGRVHGPEQPAVDQPADRDDQAACRGRGVADGPARHGGRDAELGQIKPAERAAARRHVARAAQCRSHRRRARRDAQAQHTGAGDTGGHRGRDRQWRLRRRRARCIRSLRQRRRSHAQALARRVRQGRPGPRRDHRRLPTIPDEPTRPDHVRRAQRPDQRPPRLPREHRPAHG